MLAEPIISVIYQHGRFDAYEAAEAAGALRFYAIGLAGYAALKVLVNAFYALDRRKTPMIVSFLAVGLNLLFNWIFTFRLGWGTADSLSRPVGRDVQFPAAVYPDASAPRKSSSRGAWPLLCSRSPWRARRSRRSVPHRSRWLLADWATQPFWSKTSALLATVFVGALVFACVAEPCSRSRSSRLIAGVKRRFRRAALSGWHALHNFARRTIALRAHRVDDLPKRIARSTAMLRTHWRSSYCALRRIAAAQAQSETFVIHAGQSGREATVKIPVGAVLPFPRMPRKRSSAMRIRKSRRCACAAMCAST